MLKKSRIDFYTSTTIKEIQGKTVTLSNEKIIDTDKILLGAGRFPDIDFGNFSEKLNIKKYIDTDNNFKTNFENIFAIGDINGISMLVMASQLRNAQ